MFRHYGSENNYHGDESASNCSYDGLELSSAPRPRPRGRQHSNIAEEEEDKDKLGDREQGGQRKQDSPFTDHSDNSDSVTRYAFF